MTTRSNAPAGVVQNYERSARRSRRFYLLTLLGAAFALTPVFVKPPRDCVAWPCDGWLHLGTTALGLLFCLVAVRALRRNDEWGSRIDLGEQAIVWRSGPQPAPEHRIALGDIASVKLDEAGESLGLWLKDRDGAVLPLPTECVPRPAADWVAALTRAAPHIRLHRN